jgi:hypothetical protein
VVDGSSLVTRLANSQLTLWLLLESVSEVFRSVEFSHKRNFFTLVCIASHKIDYNKVLEENKSRILNSDVSSWTAPMCRHGSCANLRIYGGSFQEGTKHSGKCTLVAMPL